MCRLQDSRVIAATPAKRRILAGSIADKVPGTRLLAFNVADTHLHLELALNRTACGRAARRLELSLRRRLQLNAPFQAVHLRPILDQHHLASTFDYILRQYTRHGLPPDPYHEGSSLPDLLGLRVLLPDVRRTVREHLPRTGPQQWLLHLGVKETGILDASCPPPSMLLALSGEEMVAAALRAAGCPRAQGNVPTRVAMRRALMAAVGEHVGPATLAPHLGVTRRALRLCRRRPADQRLVCAIQRQLKLVLRLREHNARTAAAQQHGGE